MFTWCSESTSATSRSSFERSSASISTDDHVVAGRVVVPLDVDDPVGLALQAQRVGAVGAVHRDAAAAGDEAHDLVAGHRRAAAREPHHHVVETFDVHAGGRVARGSGPRRRALHRDRQLLLAAAQLRLHALHDRLGRDVALADRGVSASRST